ncbi:MAG: glutaredoxin family protein [Candidatus Aenigmatarchaeota archaeon]
MNMRRKSQSEGKNKPENSEGRKKGIISSARGFFSSRFNCALIAFLVVTGLFAWSLQQGQNTEDSSEGLSVHFFWLPTCPHCSEQKPIYYEVKARMILENPEVRFYEHDASSIDGSRLFYKMATEAGLDTSRLGVPTIFVGKTALIGFHTKEQIIFAIEDCISKCKSGSHGEAQSSQGMNTSLSDYELPFLGRVDLTAYSLPTLAIVLGLIDGFNPCAMWVLVFLIGLLIGLEDRKKVWFIVGTFVLSSGILYFLFMTAWLNIFLFMGYLTIVTILIGLLALGGGIVGLKEYFTSKDALTCRVVDEESHEKTMNKIQKIVSQPLSVSIFISVIALAFVVNSVEFVCSAAIPAVFAQVLALSNLTPIQSYAYIALYVFFFMLDDLVIFGMAAFAISSTFGERYAKICKLFGGVIMVILGLILLFAPNLLR